MRAFNYEKRLTLLMWWCRLFLLLALVAALCVIWRPVGSWWQWLATAGLLGLCATGCSMASDSVMEDYRYVLMMEAEKAKYESGN